MDVGEVRAGRDRSSQDAAWMVMGSLIAGIAFYGVIGWLLGGWLGQQPMFTAGGVLLGMAAGTYLVHVRLGSMTKEGSEVTDG